jgi:hypothetical protein
VNHECDASLFEDVFHEVIGKSAESVSVGHHNSLDASAQYGVQKGLKPFALEVKAGADVGNELMVRVSCLEFVCLSVEVSALMFGRNARVNNFFARQGLFPFSLGVCCVTQ